MKLKLVAAGIIASVLAAAAIVPVAFAKENGPANGVPFQRSARFQEGQETPPPGEGKGHFRGGPGGHAFKEGMRFGGVDGIQIAADTLGMSVDDLRSELVGGKSILDVATGAGKGDAVKQAVADAMTAQINQAVADGRISQEKADQALADLSTRVEHMLSFTGKMDPRRGPGGCEGKHGAPPQDDGGQSTTTSITA